MRPRGPAGRDRAARTRRDHRLRRALQRPRAGALSAHAARGDAGDPRRVRRRHRRAPAVGLFRGRHHRGVRHAVAAGAERRGGLRHLCGAHAARQTAAAVAAVARGAGRDAVDRSGDARQPRTGAHARRRTARLAARRHRPHRDGGRLAAAGAAARRAADRSRSDRRGGSTRVAFSSTTPSPASRPASFSTPPPIWRARCRGWWSAAAGRATSPPSATASRRRRRLPCGSMRCPQARRS